VDHGPISGQPFLHWLAPPPSAGPPADALSLGRSRNPRSRPREFPGWIRVEQINLLTRREMQALFPDRTLMSSG
jgi:hypothetical protein